MIDKRSVYVSSCRDSSALRETKPLKQFHARLIGLEQNGDYHLECRPVGVFDRMRNEPFANTTAPVFARNIIRNLAGFTKRLPSFSVWRQRNIPHNHPGIFHYKNSVAILVVLEPRLSALKANRNS